mgnify:CR=1 FL=1
MRRSLSWTYESDAPDEVKRFDAPTPGYYTLREAAHHAPRPLFELPPVHRLDIRRTIQTFAHHH